MSRFLLSFCIILLSFLCSCGVVISGGAPVEESRGKPKSQREIARLGIPPGHLPPPGACRIWIPGTPSGHQSPPGECTELRSRVPIGAWLLSRDANDPEHIEVLVFDEEQALVVIEIRYFEAASGRFIRAELP